MAGSKEFEGKNLQEVLEAASASTGIAEPDLDYEIVEQGRRGLFGVGAKSIRIRLMPPIHKVVADELMPAATGRATHGVNRGHRTDRRSEIGQGTGQGRESGQGRGAGRGRDETGKGRESGKRRGRGRGRERNRAQTRRREEHATKKHPPVDASPEDIESVGSTVQKMVELMGLELETRAAAADSGVSVEVDGADLKLMTQKDGQLMSAVQFLLNRMARRRWPDAGRIQLSCSGQLRRRDEELVELTREVADQVGRTGETKRLHEMNAYERRLVHITIREFEELDSRSEGDGHLKRVSVFKR